MPTRRREGSSCERGPVGVRAKLHLQLRVGHHETAKSLELPARPHTGMMVIRSVERNRLSGDESEEGNLHLGVCQAAVLAAVGLGEPRRLVPVDGFAGTREHDQVADPLS